MIEGANEVDDVLARATRFRGADQLGQVFGSIGKLADDGQTEIAAGVRRIAIDDLV